jgi:hypothetical protein
MCLWFAQEGLAVSTGIIAWCATNCLKSKLRSGARWSRHETLTISVKELARKLASLSNRYRNRAKQLNHLSYLIFFGCPGIFRTGSASEQHSTLKEFVYLLHVSNRAYERLGDVQRRRTPTRQHYCPMEHQEKPQEHEGTMAESTRSSGCLSRRLYTMN